MNWRLRDKASVEEELSGLSLRNEKEVLVKRALWGRRSQLEISREQRFMSNEVSLLRTQTAV